MRDVFGGAPSWRWLLPVRLPSTVASEGPRLFAEENDGEEMSLKYESSGSVDSSFIDILPMINNNASSSGTSGSNGSKKYNSNIDRSPTNGYSIISDRQHSGGRNCGGDVDHTTCVHREYSATEDEGCESRRQWLIGSSPPFSSAGHPHGADGLNVNGASARLTSTSNGGENTTGTSPWFKNTEERGPTTMVEFPANGTNQIEIPTDSRNNSISTECTSRMNGNNNYVDSDVVLSSSDPTGSVNGASTLTVLAGVCSNQPCSGLQPPHGPPSCYPANERWRWEN